MLAPVSRAYAPPEVMDLAHARREARAERDWARADELKAAIEAIGWTVVDRGVDFELRPRVPPDVIRDGVVHYGASTSVPSTLDDAATLRSSIVLVGLPGAAGRIAAPLDEAVEVIAVVARDSAVELDRVELIRTATRFSPGGARNAGLRRTHGETVVMVDTSAPFDRPDDDRPAPPIADAATLVRWLSQGGLDDVEAVLADPTVGVVGLTAYGSDDLRRFVPDGGGEPVAVGGPIVAFRRPDLGARGPFDERLLTPAAVDIAWSLALRDDGEAEPPRRAAILDIGPDPAIVPADHDARLPRRDAYRLAELFAERRHLLHPSVSD